VLDAATANDCQTFLQSPVVRFAVVCEDSLQHCRLRGVGEKSKLKGAEHLPAGKNRITGTCSDANKLSQHFVVDSSGGWCQNSIHATEEKEKAWAKAKTNLLWVRS
jgi:hypothetical protein